MVLALDNTLSFLSSINGHSMQFRVEMPLIYSCNQCRNQIITVFLPNAKK